LLSNKIERNIPVIIITAVNKKEALQIANQEKMTEILFKPCMKNDILNKINKVILSNK